MSGARVTDPGWAVIDTNVWLDIYVFQNAGTVPLAQALQESRIRAWRTSATDAELRNVLERPAISRWRPAQEVRASWEAWQLASDCFDESAIQRSPLTCRDRDDQKFLDLAFSSRAGWLFSKDKALLCLARRARQYGLNIAVPGGL